jgi:hypothetical protein
LKVYKTRQITVVLCSVLPHKILVCNPFHCMEYMCCYCYFSISPLLLLFCKCSLFLISKCLFVFPIYVLTILAIDLINAQFIFWWNVIFQVGIQNIFDAIFVLRRKYYLVVFVYFVKFIMCPWMVSKLFVGDFLI